MSFFASEMRRPEVTPVEGLRGGQSRHKMIGNSSKHLCGPADAAEPPALVSPRAIVPCGRA